MALATVHPLVARLLHHQRLLPVECPSALRKHQIADPRKLRFRFGPDTPETTQILSKMKVTLPISYQKEWGWGFIILLMALNLNRGLKPFLGGKYALKTPLLSLLHPLGLYFLFDHSIKGELHISDLLQANYGKLYVKAILFTLGAVLLRWGFYTFNIWKTGAPRDCSLFCCHVSVSRTFCP